MKSVLLILFITISAMALEKPAFAGDDFTVVLPQGLEVKKTFSVDDASDLFISNIRGKIEVLPSASDKIHAIATASAPFNKSFQCQLHVIVNKTEGMSIRVEYPESTGFGGSHVDRDDPKWNSLEFENDHSEPGSVDLLIYVPEIMLKTIEVQSHLGNIRVEGFNSLTNNPVSNRKVKAQTRSGEIVLKNTIADGGVFVKSYHDVKVLSVSSKGAIVVRDSDNVSIESVISDGGIFASETGKVSVKDSNSRGQVYIKSIHGGIEIKNSSSQDVLYAISNHGSVEILNSSSQVAIGAESVGEPVVVRNCIVTADAAKLAGGGYSMDAGPINQGLIWGYSVHDTVSIEDNFAGTVAYQTTWQEHLLQRNYLAGAAVLADLGSLIPERLKSKIEVMRMGSKRPSIFSFPAEIESCNDIYGIDRNEE